MEFCLVSTDFDEEEIFEWFKRFRNDCPNGKLTRAQLRWGNFYEKLDFVSRVKIYFHSETWWDSSILRETPRRLLVNNFLYFPKFNGKLYQIQVISWECSIQTGMIILILKSSWWRWTYPTVKQVNISSLQFKALSWTFLAESKLTWAFKLYDVDNDGFIGKI